MSCTLTEVEIFRIEKFIDDLASFKCLNIHKFVARNRSSGAGANRLHTWIVSQIVLRVPIDHRVVDVIGNDKEFGLVEVIAKGADLGNAAWDAFRK